VQGTTTRLSLRFQGNPRLPSRYPRTAARRPEACSSLARASFSPIARWTDGRPSVGGGRRRSISMTMRSSNKIDPRDGSRKLIGGYDCGRARRARPRSTGGHLVRTAAHDVKRHRFGANRGPRNVPGRLRIAKSIQSDRLPLRWALWLSSSALQRSGRRPFSKFKPGSLASDRAPPFSLMCASLLAIGNPQAAPARIAGRAVKPSLHSRRW
jgi:hypothetical protein